MIMNGDVVISRQREPSVAAYVCDRGYEIINGDARRECGSNGFWLGTQPSCQSKRTIYCLTFLEGGLV